MALKLIDHKVIYSGVVFNTIVDEVEYESGNRSVREVAEHPGGAVVLPVLDDGRIVFVHQYRYPLKEYLYELPAGKLEPNEPPEECARRELKEETGYDAGRLEKLTAIYTTPGFCTEKLHIFVARDLRDGKQQLEEGELGLSLKYVPASEAFEMVRRNEIVDAKTIVGLFFLEKLLNR
ncbi:MAG TPA: NUDIX hydrolase [Candidatus Kryptobacter bacterium]|nr:MAG: ADP-ribose pyrophosphatase [Ignavibacteriae bacterium 37-53-5]HQT91191.1 NUDIX hydrolase [Candidatus Kryptobacter bacterium]